MPPPPTVCQRYYVFGSPDRDCMRACVLLARRLTNQWTEFHQTLCDDVVEATDELVRFEGRAVKVKIAARSDVQNFGMDRHSHRRICNSSHLRVRDMIENPLVLTAPDVNFASFSLTYLLCSHVYVNMSRSALPAQVL